MIRIVAIVEGDGEVKAVPVLLRRIGAAVAPLAALDMARPIRVPRGRFLKASGLEGYVSLAASRAGPDGRILVLLDANGDCPAELGAALLQRARAARPDLLIEVVLAKCEYEAWFIAAADSLRGTRGISSAANVPPDPESIRGAKEWLRARMSGPYSPTADQAALTARFDMTAARRRAPSFDKMWRAVIALMLSARSQEDQPGCRPPTVR